MQSLFLATQHRITQAIALGWFIVDKWPASLTDTKASLPTDFMAPPPMGSPRPLIQNQLVNPRRRNAACLFQIIRWSKTRFCPEVSLHLGISTDPLRPNAALILTVELQRQFLALRRAGALPLQASLERRSFWSCALFTHRELSFVFSLGAKLPDFLPNQVTLQLHFRCYHELRTLSETFHTYTMISLSPFTISTLVGVSSRIYDTSLADGTAIAARSHQARLTAALKTLYSSPRSIPKPFFTSTVFKYSENRISRLPHADASMSHTYLSLYGSGIPGPNSLYQRAWTLVQYFNAALQM